MFTRKKQSYQQGLQHVDRICRAEICVFNKKQTNVVIICLCYAVEHVSDGGGYLINPHMGDNSVVNVN